MTGLIPIAVLATLLVAGLVTRQVSSHPSAAATSRPSPAPVPRTTPSRALPPGAEVTRPFDAHGVFFTYPSHWHPAARPTGARLVPEDPNWVEVLHGSPSDRLAVAAYPRRDPGSAAARAGITQRVGRRVAALLGSPPPFRVSAMTTASATGFLYSIPGGADAPSTTVSGYVVFSARTRYVIGCQVVYSATSDPCAAIVATFRLTGRRLSETTPIVRSVVGAVYAAWRAGHPSGARSLMTSQALADLAGSPWTTGTGPPSSCVPSQAPVGHGLGSFQCLIPNGNRAAKLLVLRPVRGRWKVTSVGDCTGTIASFGCVFTSVLR